MITETIEITNLTIIDSINGFNNVIAGAQYTLKLESDITGIIKKRPVYIAIKMENTPFVEYESVTEENVINWIKSSTQHQEIVKKLSAIIEGPRATQVISTINTTEFPWNKIV